jgi:putative glutathione S-transferase
MGAPRLARACPQGARRCHYRVLCPAEPHRSDGWIYDREGPFGDPLLGVNAIHEVYAQDAKAYTGRLTVPVLWDKKTGRIVSNESADIVRMLNAAFDQGPDLYPAELAGHIDRHNEAIYSEVNNGVYRAGFASTQDAYERAAWALFEALERLDAMLAERRYLCGEVFTEADVRLFPTLARFDVAYHYAFRCNLKKLSDYAHLWAYARAIYQMQGVAETVRFDIYKKGYFSASEKRNPLGHCAHRAAACRLGRRARIAKAYLD